MENQQIIITTIPKVITGLYRENDNDLIKLIAEEAEKMYGQNSIRELWDYDNCIDERSSIHGKKLIHLKSINQNI